MHGMSVHYFLDVKTEGTPPGRIPAWRLMLILPMAVVLYLVGRLIVTPAQTHPAILLAGLPLAALIGVLVAKAQTSRARRPQRGRRLSASDGRWYVFGLAGAGIGLSQAMPPTFLEWLTLGLVGLMAGAASHAWYEERHPRALGAK